MSSIIPTLHSKSGSVTLRPLQKSDLPALAEFCRDPRAVEFIPMIPLNYSDDDALFFYDLVQAKWADGSSKELAVESDFGFSGTVNLHDFRNRTAAVGINIGPIARGSSIATEAVQLLLDWGFNTLGLTRIYWHCDVGNWASRKMAWKNGFVFVAELPGFGVGRDEAVDSWLLTLRSDQQRSAPNEAWQGPRSPRAEG